MGGPNWSQGNPVGWADVDEFECIEAVHFALDRCAIQHPPLRPRRNNLK